MNVSIVNWVKDPSTPPGHFVLDGVEVEGITPSLRPLGQDPSEATPLAPNMGKAFQGPQPVGSGFVLDEDEAMRLLELGEASYRDVVRPHIVGDDALMRGLTQAVREWGVAAGAGDEPSKHLVPGSRHRAALVCT